MIHHEATKGTKGKSREWVGHGGTHLCGDASVGELEDMEAGLMRRETERRMALAAGAHRFSC